MIGDVIVPLNFFTERKIKANENFEGAKSVIQCFFCGFNIGLRPDFQSKDLHKLISNNEDNFQQGSLCVLVNSKKIINILSSKKIKILPASVKLNKYFPQNNRIKQRINSLNPTCLYNYIFDSKGVIGQAEKNYQNHSDRKKLKVKIYTFLFQFIQLMEKIELFGNKETILTIENFLDLNSFKLQQIKNGIEFVGQKEKHDQIRISNIEKFLKISHFILEQNKINIKSITKHN